MKCNRCLLTDDIPGVTINDHQCNFCDMHDDLEKLSKIKIEKILKNIKKSGRGCKYDCVIGISGGFDSSYLLHLLAVKFNLRTLAVHFNNGWNSEDAENNMRVMIDGTGVDSLVVGINNAQLNNLNLGFLRAGVSDADIPNDMAMSKIIYNIAEKFKIKTIINGHNYRYEGSTPLGWSYMDAKYIQSVAEYYNIDISSYPILTFWDQIKYMIKGYKTIRFLYYINHDKNLMKKMLHEKYGWKDYGGNHSENIYTEFVGNYLLPRKFNINKKIIYRSAELRSGVITEEDAIENLKQSEFDKTKIELIEKKLGVSMDEIMSYTISNRNKFKNYHNDFKKWKFLIKFGVKVGFFPMTFYKKYCK